MMHETFFAVIGVVFIGMLVIGVLAIGLCMLVTSLKEWFYEKRMNAKRVARLLETQRELMEANNRLNERVTAIEEELRSDAE